VGFLRAVWGQLLRVKVVPDLITDFGSRVSQVVEYARRK
jgi:hypothetical protein